MKVEMTNKVPRLYALEHAPGCKLTLGRGWECAIGCPTLYRRVREILALTR